MVEELRAALPLGEPFNDPGVAHFGLHNAVMALGDTFVEVVSPVEDGTAAGRQLDRLGGDGGYMLMFQLDDVGPARERLDRLGVRVVFEIDLPDIKDLHLHPRDLPGAIVALDHCRPTESWRWGGPAWTEQAPAETGPGRFTGATLTAPDPAKVASTYAAVLGVEADGGTIGLDGGELRFEPGDAERLVAFHVDGVEVDSTIAGVRFAAAG